MSRYESAGPLKGMTKVMDPLTACVKVADYCDPSSTGTLTCVKLLATMFDSVCAIVSE
jgi:hypothetical protein